MSKIYWNYVKEEYKDKKKKDHINHLWYISTIDDNDIEMGVEAEVFRIDNGPFQVTLYKAPANSGMVQKVKTQKFKTLVAAKKTAQNWVVKGVDEYVKRIKTIQSAIKRLSCNE